ncbi:fluoride efflux transporter FluC [Halorubrum amylolyticum]|uniref:fluoride efflux transporter FluC n=1 Tax=Halorubrum amylolyticum TaxID=2508724 RepID=UPI001008FB80|nr:CrcB family protein [Halorubrum amylolyticum]
MTDPLVASLLVGLGGSAGAVGRHAIGLRIEGRRSVVAVNALGSLALGGLFAAPVGSGATLFAAVGFCGAFTTFSSFAVETVSTAADGEGRTAARFAATNVAAALLAFLVGAAVGGGVA